MSTEVKLVEDYYHACDICGVERTRRTDERLLARARKTVGKG